MTLPWRLKSWNGSSWVNDELRSWDGSNWQLRNGYYWTGSAWELITDRTPPYSNFTTDFLTHSGGSYRESNARRTDTDGLANNYQGYNTSTWGNQRSMWMVDNNMQSLMSGYVNRYWCQMLIDNQHTYWNDGGTMGLGTHAVRQTTPPGTFSINRYRVHTFHFAKGEIKWVDVASDFIQWAADGSFCGVVANFADNASEYYGYYSKALTVRMNYDK